MPRLRRARERTQRSRTKVVSKAEAAALGVFIRAFSILVILGCALCCGFPAHAQQSPPQPTLPQPPSTPLPQPPQPPPSKPPVATASPTRAAILRFVVVLDPAHGGTDLGAVLSGGKPEKDSTLSLALRLRTMLNARGIHSILTRSSDVAIANQARAVSANRAQAATCVLLHASSSGNGVHLFTSSLPAANPAPSDPRRAFLPWRTAQANYSTQSLRLESDLNSALAAQHIPALLDKTYLAPLDNLTCPAVAVEVAPLNASTPVDNAAYQQQIAKALVSALVAWRSDWRSNP